MPTSETGSSSRSSSAATARGFTLVEILVVVVIIGIVATAAVLSVGVTGQDRELETESQRLVALMNYVREQAELQGRELGLYCDEDGYEFLAFDPRRELWRPLDTDDALRPRDLPRDIRVRLRIEGRPVVLRRPEREAELAPHVMIFSNGDLTPFELTLERERSELRATLAAGEAGDIELLDPEERRP